MSLQLLLEAAGKKDSLEYLWETQCPQNVFYLLFVCPSIHLSIFKQPRSASEIKNAPFRFLQENFNCQQSLCFIMPFMARKPEVFPAMFK